jgi:hypothetical protein
MPVKSSITTASCGTFDGISTNPPASQDHLFAADLELQRAADAVAELFAVVLMPRHNAAVLRGQKRHRGFVVGALTIFSTTG